MFSYQHYVPVLKCKQGERGALRQLTTMAFANQVTPLIELEEPPEGRTLEHHVPDLQFEEDFQSWGLIHPFFLDVEALAGYQTATGVTGADYAFDTAATLNLKFIPVIGLRRMPSETAAALRHRQRGLCLRLDETDLSTMPLDQQVNAFIAGHGLQPGNVDLVLDLGSVYQDDPARVEAVSLYFLNALPNPVTTWRTLTIVASAFPESMGELSGSSSATFPRTEWIVWLRHHARRNLFQRLPTFGDYGIQYPEMLVGFDPRIMDVSAAIRYTLDQEWLILKGRGMKRVGGRAQFPTLAATLVNDPRYMGQRHCQGCTEIHACANGASGLANSSAWRRIGAVHHVTVVRQQLSALPFP